MSQDQPSKSQQLQGQPEGYLQELATATDQARVSEVLQTYLNTLSQFHRYSWNNIILILMQRPEATRVAGYKTWQKLGRQVERGEKGIAIFCPLLKKVTDEHEQEETRLVGFRVGHVFDVTQTTGEPLPAPPTWTNAGQDGAELARFLKRVAQSLKITVRTGILPGAAQGASEGGSITLRHGLSPKAQASTLAHELAHELLHQRQHAAAAPAAETQARQQREIEAEAAAYAICRHFGLEINSPNYLALWATDSTAIQARLERIAYAAKRIIQLVEEIARSAPAQATSEPESLPLARAA